MISYFVMLQFLYDAQLLKRTDKSLICYIGLIQTKTDFTRQIYYKNSFAVDPSEEDLGGH
jgi:hypothetical protein